MKKLYTILLVAGLTVGLAACGQFGDKTKAQPTDQAATQPQDTTTTVQQVQPAPQDASTVPAQQVQPMQQGASTATAQPAMPAQPVSK